MTKEDPQPTFNCPICKKGKLVEMDARLREPGAYSGIVLEVTPPPPKDPLAYVPKVLRFDVSMKICTNKDCEFLSSYKGKVQ